MKLIYLCALISLATAYDDIQGVNQVHLSLGEKPREFVVTYSSPFPLLENLVMYDCPEAEDSTTHLSHGWERKFVDNGTLHHTQYIYRHNLEVMEERVKCE